MTKGLGGHFVPGIQFLLIGSWWIYSAWLRYFLCRARNRPYFVSFPFPLLGFGARIARLPLEQCYILISAVAGFIIELSAGFGHRIDLETGESSMFIDADNLHHFSMYLLFFHLTIIELFVHYCTWVPKRIEMVAGTFTFAGQAFLFYFHSKTDMDFDGVFHKILFLVICATALSIIGETVQRENQIVATLMRGYFTMLMGAWFCLSGYYLDEYFHPVVHRNEHEWMHRFSMLLAFYLTLFVVLLFLLMLAIGFLANVIIERCATEIHLQDRSKDPLIQGEDAMMMSDSI